MAMIRQLDMGWDSNGAQEFITQLRTNVIANTKADLEAHGQIMTALENGWIGENKDIFVTVDLDVLDTSVMPGTGTPEAGGLSFNELVDWFKYLSQFNIIGADVVELAPDYDTSGVSTAVATKVIRELLMIIN